MVVSKKSQESSGFVNAGWLVYAATDSGQAIRGNW